MPIVSGRILNSKGSPIPEARVSLDSYGDNSNSGGRYELEVPVGSYTLKAVKKGYRTVSRDIEVDEDMTVNITIAGE